MKSLPKVSPRSVSKAKMLNLKDGSTLNFFKKNYSLLFKFFFVFYFSSSSFFFFDSLRAGIQRSH